MTTSASKAELWAGRIMSAVPALFLLVDGIMKLAKPAIVVETTVQLGFPESVIIGLGIVLLASTVLYLVPATSVLGAILLTGYLGGAVATHVRVGGDVRDCLPDHRGCPPLGWALLPRAAATRADSPPHLRLTGGFPIRR